MKTFLSKIFTLSIAVILLTSIAFTSNAQFFYGVKAGYLSSKLNGNDAFGGINYYGSVSGGMSFGFKFRTDLNFQWEVLYSQKGMHQKFIMKDNINGYKNDTTPTFRVVTKQYDNYLKLSYLEVPIYLKKSFSFKGGIMPYDRDISKWDIDFYIGAYAGYLFASTADLNANRQVSTTIYGNTEDGETMDTTGSFEIGQNVTARAVMASEDDSIAKETLLAQIPEEDRDINDLNKIDVGVIGGIGFSVELNPSTKLSIDARYTMGLLTIDKEYFADKEYVFVQDDENGTIEMQNSLFRLNENTTKKMLTNSSIGIYIGFTHYIGTDR